MKPVEIIGVLVLLFASASGCDPFDHTQATLIATDVDVPAGRWVRLEAPEPLRTPSDDNEVCLRVSEGWGFDGDAFALVSPDGRRVVPRVELISSEGSLVALTLPIYQGDFCLSTETGKPPHAPYRAVRIRGDVGLSLREIWWYSTHK
jgi:hypothetical protein